MQSTPHDTPAPLVFMGLIGLDSHNPEEARLVQRLAERGHPVVYLAPLGIREPGPRDWFGGLQRLRRTRQTQAPTRNVRTAVLLVLPWRRWPPVAWCNLRLVRWQIVRALRSLAGERPVLWLRLPTPELVAQLDALDTRAVLYECIDDYSAYPHYQPAELRYLERTERTLVSQADLVITLSEVVAARFPQAADRTRVVPLGADLARCGHPSAHPPADLARLARPRLGLVGGLDERVDFELLRQIALAEPDWSIVLIGPVVDRPGLSRVADLPNVYVLGSRSPERVPDYLNGLDVCLIPYRRTRWTAGCFPAKLLEYLASGRPIVATNLPGLATYASVIDLASDSQAFLAACRRSVVEQGPAAVARRRAVAATASLESRIDIIEELMAALPRR